MFDEKEKVLVARAREDTWTNGKRICKGSIVLITRVGSLSCEYYNAETGRSEGWAPAASFEVVGEAIINSPRLGICGVSANKRRSPVEEEMKARHDAAENGPTPEDGPDPEPEDDDEFEREIEDLLEELDPYQE